MLALVAITNNQKDMTIYIQGDHSAYTQGSIVIDNNGDGSGQYANQETGLTINNDGKGKATIQLGEEKITVDADPLEKPAKLPLLSSVSNAPSSLEANNLLITLNANILFDVDKYDVRQDAQTTLNNLANILKQANIAAFEINGYSDSDGSDEDNQTLSENYANNVNKNLSTLNIKIRNFNKEILNEQFNDVEVEQNSKDIVCFLSKINIRELELNNKTNIDLNMILTQEEIKKYFENNLKFLSLLHQYCFHRFHHLRGRSFNALPS